MLAAIFVCLVVVHWCHAVVQRLATVPWSKLFSAMVIAAVCKHINMTQQFLCSISSLPFLLLSSSVAFLSSYTIGSMDYLLGKQLSASVGSLACLL
jgi:hypothetical protein